MRYCALLDISQTFILVKRKLLSTDIKVNIGSSEVKKKSYSSFFLSVSTASDCFAARVMEDTLDWLWTGWWPGCVATLALLTVGCCSSVSPLTIKVNRALHILQCSDYFSDIIPSSSASLMAKLLQSLVLTFLLMKLLLLEAWYCW